MRPLFPLLLVVLGLASACGGADEPPVYDEAASRACVRAQGLKPTTRGLDFVAETALGGAFRSNVGDKKVVVVFGLTSADADRTELAYRNFAPKGYRVQDVLRRNENVVMLWSLPPSDEQHDKINGCLREAPSD